MERWDWKDIERIKYLCQTAEMENWWQEDRVK